MFWIGLLVGLVIATGAYVFIYWLGLKYFGLKYNELFEVVETLEGVGDCRDSEINVIKYKDTEFEICEAVEFRKE